MYEEWLEFRAAGSQLYLCSRTGTTAIVAKTNMLVRTNEMLMQVFIVILEKQS
jgi:hypothetical protein